MVIRNPIPLNGNLFPYNNCLVAVAQGQKSVWLPAYTFDFPQHTLLQELEEETKTIWHELGFNPCLVSASFSDLLGVKAGLHCITNELRG